MPKTYAAKAAEIEVEIAQVEHDLAHAPEDQRSPLQARLGSLKRSLMWYQARIPRRIEPLAVGVGDDVMTYEAN